MGIMPLKNITLQSIDRSAEMVQEHVCSVACVNSLACPEGGVSLHAFLLERCYFI
jgi:hypothetical protein